MNRRGMSHIEIIMSFIIFVGAIGFAMYFFNPFSSNRLVESSLTWSFREIINNVSIEINTFSVSVNDSEDQIGETLAVWIEGMNENQNLRSKVLDRNGNSISSKLDVGSSGKMDTVYINKDDWEESDFVFIMLSEDYALDLNVSGLPQADRSFYEIASSNSKKVLSEKRVLDLERKYQLDYFGLKKDFNLPNRVNFGFLLSFSENDLIEAQKERPANLEVFSETERKEVLRENGETMFGDLTISVW